MTHCYLFWANSLHYAEVWKAKSLLKGRVQCSRLPFDNIYEKNQCNMAIFGRASPVRQAFKLHTQVSVNWMMLLFNSDAFHVPWEIRFAWAKVMILSEPEHTACLFKINLSDKRELEIPNYKHSLLAPSSSRDHYSLNQKWGRSSLLSSCIWLPVK